MVRFTFVLIFVFVMKSYSFACLNIYYSVDNEGHFHETEAYSIPFNKTFNFKLIEKHLLETEEKLLLEKSYELLSDYAVYLMKGGKLEEALQILIVLSQHFPNEYQIAANLGTAYELNGNADSALVYIQRGIELNPNSHGGSEWVHVKILETKIKQRSEPDYLTKNSVLQLSELQEKDSVVCSQILTQVRERFPFCPGPDSIMASLMVDLGDCYANSVSIEYAKVNYEIAQKYFGDNSEETKNKIAEMLRLRSKYQTYTTRLTTEGSSIKSGNVRYEKMMDDNNDPPYEINWDKINTNVDSLLSIVGLSVIPVQTQPVDTIANREVVEQVTTAKPSNSNWVIYLSLGAAAFLFGLIWIRKRGQTKQ